MSGWNLNDTLTGQEKLLGAANPGTPLDQNYLKAKNVGLIDGLAELLGYTDAEIALLDPESAVIVSSLVGGGANNGAEIIIGGGGSDTIKGNIDNDVLDGDAWLNVRIRVLNAVGAENIASQRIVQLSTAWLKFLHSSYQEQLILVN